MFSLNLSLKIQSVSIEGSETFFDAIHVDGNGKSFTFKGIMSRAVNLEVGRNYLAINAIPKNYDGDSHCKHLYFDPRSTLVECGNESVNNLLIVGRTTDQSKNTSGVSGGNTWNLCKFNIISNANYYDKTLANKDGTTGGKTAFSLLCEYWNRFPAMQKGNQYIVSGQLISSASTDGKEYFNVRVTDMGFGSVSTKNAAEPKAA